MVLKQKRISKLALQLNGDRGETVTPQLYKTTAIKRLFIGTGGRTRPFFPAFARQICLILLVNQAQSATTQLYRFILFWCPFWCPRRFAKPPSNRKFWRDVHRSSKPDGKQETSVVRTKSAKRQTHSWKKISRNKGKPIFGEVNLWYFTASCQARNHRHQQLFLHFLYAGAFGRDSGTEL